MHGNAILGRAYLRYQSLAKTAVMNTLLVFSRQSWRIYGSSGDVVNRGDRQV